MTELELEEIEQVEKELEAELSYRHDVYCDCSICKNENIEWYMGSVL